jgi:hypothetical protein
MRSARPAPATSGSDVAVLGSLELRDAERVIVLDDEFVVDGDVLWYVDVLDGAVLEGAEYVLEDDVDGAVDVLEFEDEGAVDGAVRALEDVADEFIAWSLSLGAEYAEVEVSGAGFARTAVPPAVDVKLISCRPMISPLMFFATRTSLWAPGFTASTSITFCSSLSVPLFVLSRKTSIMGRGIEFTSRFSVPISAGMRVSTTTRTVLPETVAPSRGSTTFSR